VIKKGLAVNPDPEQGVRIMALAQYEQGKKGSSGTRVGKFVGLIGLGAAPVLASRPFKEASDLA